MPPKPGRYFCRVRIADASGAVSEDGAILPIVLQVPSTAAMPTPVNGGASVTGGTLLVDVALDPDPELAWAIVFARAGPITETPPDPRRPSCCACRTGATCIPREACASGWPTARC